MSAPWAGAVAVAEGALCYLGALADADTHHHVATQLVRAWSGTFELTDGHGRTAVASAAVIPSGCEHSIRILEPHVAGVLVFVDPALTIDPGPAHAVAVEQWVAAGHALNGWREPSVSDPAVVLTGFLAALPERSRRADWHPSVRAAVALITQGLPGPVGLAATARAVSMSPSRLSRLFNDQVGQSFPTYVRWVRLRRAVEALQDGASLTDAAHAAGFTDSAHANRVCHEMFGLSPSRASRNLMWA